LRNRLRRLLNPPVDIDPHPLIERANGSFQLNFIGNDVAADAALNSADRDDCRCLCYVDLATDNRLHAEHDLRCNNNRVNAAPGNRSVRLSPLDRNHEPVHGGQGAT